MIYFTLVDFIKIIVNFRVNQKILAKKIEPKVYEYEFLKVCEKKTFQVWQTWKVLQFSSHRMNMILLKELKIIDKKENLKMNFLFSQFYVNLHFKFV